VKSVRFRGKKIPNNCQSGSELEGTEKTLIVTPQRKPPTMSHREECVFRSAEAPEHFGWLAAFIERDLPTSSAKTQKVLGWKPTECGLIADLDRAQFI